MKLYDNNPLMSQGVAPMSEPVTVTYMDLDRLIDTCNLLPGEKFVVELLMQGYTRADIRDDTKYPLDLITSLLNSAIEKIVEQNEYEWHRWHTKCYFVQYI